jgi:hypothetical protein
MGFFLQECVPVADDLREEVFALIWGQTGFTAGDIEEMTIGDRRWYLERIAEQRKREEKEIEQRRAEIERKNR